MWKIVNELPYELEVGSFLWEETIAGYGVYEGGKTGIFGGDFDIALKVKGTYYNRKATLIRTTVSKAKRTVVVVKFPDRSYVSGRPRPVLIEITDQGGRKESREVEVDFAYIGL